jgi:tRNA dimethylallyltransferase
VNLPGLNPCAGELLCVVGPTASGKTELAIQICERFGGEVISADSVQIYRHFDIGSGKPTSEERARARHHLVDIQDPRDALDAARFAQLAEAAIAEVRARGKTPVVCGGAFLWVRALVQGLAKAPAANPEVRARIRAEAAAVGVEAVHARLARVDPVTALRLSPNDLIRVERALEVYETSGRPLSEWHAEHRRQPWAHRARFVGPERTREQLDQRIAARVEGWLQGGWIQEVRGLIEMGMRGTRAMGSVGYRQVMEHVEGRLAAGQLSASIVRSTRIFVRRQRTWLRDVPITWIDPAGLP